jgi:predicted nucleic acid-binding protein
MIVVSDTSVLDALVKADLVFVLPQIFGEVIIPERIFQELQADSALATWLLDCPPWLRVEAVRKKSEVISLLQDVDAGEAEAIVLAEELHAMRLLIDDLAGRQVAELRGLAIVGTGGVLLIAKKQGLITSMREALDELKKRSTFRLGNSVRMLLLRQAGEM